VVTYPDGAPIIFQGVNDGMLHVVDGRTDASVPTRGRELWAYVPRLVHSSLHHLADPAYTHRYYVDGTPSAAAVTGFAFSRLLVGGLGKGGRGYYALDISSYTAATEADAANKVLWEFTNANMGFSFGNPLIVRTAAGWRVLVTSGYDNGAAIGGDGRGRLWVLNPANGNIEATLSTGAGTSLSPSGLAHISTLANSAPSDLVRYVYGGDLEGNVWRFDLDTSSVVRIAQLTAPTGVTQPVTSAPEVALIGGSKYMVMVGTGRYLADQDVPGTVGANIWATQRQSLYGIVDDTAVSSPTLPNIRGSNGATCPSGGGTADFVCQSLNYESARNSYTATTHAVDTNSRRGWYLDFPVDGRLDNGRVISKPSLTTGGTLALTFNIPTNVQCDPGGRSWFFALNGVTGGAVVINQGGNTYHDAGSFLGFALASRTVVVTTANGKRALIRMSDKTVQAPTVPEPITTTATWRRIYWRTVD
jgi:type IV pilus assembly protein PilY1